MKGRLLVTLVVLAMAAAACAEPGVGGEDDANQESETVIDEAGSGDTSAFEGTANEVSAADPGAVSDETLTNDAKGEDPTNQTSSTTGDDSLLVTDPPKETPSTTTTTRPAESNPGIDPGLAPLVDQAKGDLAGRLEVGADAIAVISAELVEWSDASLGCPQPGMAYAQVPTDGSLIVLSHGGAEYRYHTGGSVYMPFLCE